MDLQKIRILNTRDKQKFMVSKAVEQLKAQNYVALELNMQKLDPRNFLYLWCVAHLSKNRTAAASVFLML